MSECALRIAKEKATECSCYGHHRIPSQLGVGLHLLDPSLGGTYEVYYPLLRSSTGALEESPRNQIGIASFLGCLQGNPRHIAVFRTAVPVHQKLCCSPEQCEFCALLGIEARVGADLCDGCKRSIAF